MTGQLETLLSDWFDGADKGTLVEGELLASEAPHEIADSLLVHGLLTDMSNRDDAEEMNRVSAVMREIDRETASSHVGRNVSVGPTRGRRVALLTSALAVAATIMMMFALFGPNQNVSAAMASLERVMEAAARPFDRTYSIAIVEEYSNEKRPRQLSQEAWDRETKKQLDGATLYVRGANQYAMTVTLKSGEKRTSGSDGMQSWAFRETGPVHISSDLGRFRGGVPGQQQDIPFLSVHALLSQLTTGYDMERGDEPLGVGESHPLSQLIGVRRSREVRGPKRVELWFDRESGTVHEMLLEGLPRGGGGPKSLRLKLIDQSELPADFFSHRSHHEPERKVILD
ncbi:MAG: hypothetical protein AAGD07_16365 [Planctomycetota bacterium]